MADYSYEPGYISEPDITQTQTVVESSPTRNNRGIVLLIILGVALLIILVLLILRNATTPSNNGNTGNNSSDSVRLQFWGAFIPKTAIQPLLDEYKTLTGNVTVEYEDNWPLNQKSSDAALLYRKQLNKLFTDGNSFNIPDIFMVPNSWVGDYDKLYTTSSTSIDYATFKTQFYPAVVNDFAFDGSVHGVPLWMDSLAVVYNKDLLAEKAVTTPPTNWTDFKTLAESLTKRNQDGKITQAGFSAGTSQNVDYSADVLNLLIQQNEVAMLDTQGNPVFSLDSKTAEALQFYKGFLGDTWDKDLENDSLSFLKGKLAMMIVPSYRLRDLLHYNDIYGLKVSIGISQVPQINTQGISAVSWASEYWGAMVSQNRPNATAAWTFLKWLSEPAQYQKLSDNIKNDSNNKIFGIIYPRSDMNDQLKADEFLSTYNELLSNANSWYMIRGIEVKSELNKAIDSSNDASSAIQTAEENIKQIFTSKGVLPLE